MGFGILNPNSDEMQFFFYSQGIRSKNEPHFGVNDFLLKMVLVFGILLLIVK